jgi:light-regulated signal transduction histidine kinase (bacteriophytochrome)
MDGEYYKRIEEENSKLKGEISKLEKSLNSQRLFTRMVGHELGNHLGKISSYLEIIREEYSSISEEEFFNFLKIIESGAKQSILDYRLLRLSDLSSVKENSEYLKLGDLASDFIKSKEDVMKEGNLKYVQEKKVEPIYTNKSLINCVIGTLLGNSINYALPNSTIYFNTSFDPKNEFLKASFVNNTNGKKQRNAHGEGNGLGLEFVRTAMDIYEGNFENFQSNGIYTASFNIPGRNIRE